MAREDEMTAEQGAARAVRAAIYGLAALLATLIVWLAWTSLQPQGMESTPERVNREIAECHRAYRAASSGGDSSHALDRIVKPPERFSRTTITCRDLLFGQPHW